MRGIARAGADTFGDFPLEHQDHPRDPVAKAAQPFEDRAGHVERQIADNLTAGRPPSSAEVDAEEVLR